VRAGLPVLSRGNLAVARWLLALRSGRDHGSRPAPGSRERQRGRVCGKKKPLRSGGRGGEIPQGLVGGSDCQRGCEPPCPQPEEIYYRRPIFWGLRLPVRLQHDAPTYTTTLPQRR
jgi:hypothetical protein